MDMQSIAVFKMLGHPVRVRMITYIHGRGQSHVRELFEELGHKEARSWFHLNSLRHAGVVNARRIDGRELLLTLNADVIDKALAAARTDLDLVAASRKAGDNGSDARS